LFSPDAYLPRFFLRNGHLNTIWAYLFRNASKLPFERILLTTPDDDFLDVDIFASRNGKCAVLVHGLEGSSSSSYMTSMSQVLHLKGWDVAALNLRGCSGRDNKQYYAYHSGQTDDLELLCNYLCDKYANIVLLGFSLGGNVVLKYAGSRVVPQAVKAVIGISVPIHLRSTALKLEQWQNYFYSLRFLNSLKSKLKKKVEKFKTQSLSIEIDTIRTIRQFDEVYTAPANQFTDADDYYKKSSSVNFLENISVPFLLINALDDPFLTHECFPLPSVSVGDAHFVFPKYGGHVGFWTNKGKHSKHEEWVLQFLASKGL